MIKIYILFGDEPRTDGDNVVGVYSTYEEAEIYAELYMLQCYSIKEFEVEL